MTPEDWIKYRYKGPRATAWLDIWAKTIKDNPAALEEYREGVRAYRKQIEEENKKHGS